MSTQNSAATWHKARLGVSSPQWASYNGSTHLTGKVFLQVSCTGPERFVRGYPALTHFLFVFAVYEGREDPNTTISAPSSARHRNAILMTCRWRAKDGPTLNKGLVALSFFRGDKSKTLFFMIFRWGRTPYSPPSEFAHKNWEDIQKTLYNLPKGKQKKKGNQQIMKTPTTIPRVLAAFFSFLNFAILPASDIRELSFLPEPSE